MDAYITLYNWGYDYFRSLKLSLLSKYFFKNGSNILFNTCSVIGFNLMEITNFGGVQF